MVVHINATGATIQWALFPFRVRDAITILINVKPFINTRALPYKGCDPVRP